MTQKDQRPAGNGAPDGDRGDHGHRTAIVRQPRPTSRGQVLLDQLRRRYEAAKRLPPLEHSRRRDPYSARERADCWERP
jgi:hypothetical protein